MNRSILIVICDFLLLSLLTFSTDLNKMADENTQPPTKVVVATNTVANASTDLAAAMKRALEEEKQGREQLQQQLTQARTATLQQQAQMSAQAQENARLQQQFASAQTNAEDLNRQLQSVSAQAQASSQKLALTETEAKQQGERADALRQQLDALGQSNQLTLSDKQRLMTQLQVAEAERKAAADQAALMQQEIQAERAENARLAEGFKALATNSTQLTQEIRDNRALAPNTIFSGLVSNRVDANILASRPSFLGFGGDHSTKTKTVLVMDGTSLFALCHVQDTPLVLWDPGTDWDKLTGTLNWQGAEVPIHALSFHAQDPRIVMLPVTTEEATKLGGKVYRVAADPYKFQDAVIVGADEGYYGECSFQIDLTTPHYLKLDRNLLKGLFGKFNPSRGDLVFSRRGELLGMMVNNTYCLTIKDVTVAATIPFGQDLHQQPTGKTLADLYGQVFRMPLRLQ